MKRTLLSRLAAFFTLLLLVAPANAQEIEFLPSQPHADGRLNDSERSLVARQFAQGYRFDNPDVKAPDIQYRIGYTATHLYIAITTTSETIEYRNRGYVWGDGWRLLLGDTADGARTATHTEVLVSPKAPGDNRTEAVIGTQDNMQVYRALSNRSQVSEGLTDGGAVFEAVLAWDDLAPYHPVFDEGVGVNLYFAKGLSTPEAGVFPYGYAIVADEGIWEEQIQSRAVRRFTFDFETADALRTLTFYRLASKTVVESNPIAVERASFERARPGHSQKHMDVVAQNGSSEALGLTPDTRILRTTTYLSNEGLSAGRHTITLPDGTEQTLTVLPDFAPQAAREELAGALTNGLPQGAHESLLFLLDAYEMQRAKLRPYADGKDVLEATERLAQLIEVAKTGTDPFAAQKGPYRRGFRSQLDGTFQPYSVKLPEVMEPNTTYPAIVFLHGSGSDEQGLLDKPRSNGKMIEIAPYGRDKYYAYAAPASQTDIIEALDAASRDFPVDRERVIIGGFSMGGYGALRAFYENPEAYRGVAVFAGHPDLANQWLGNLGFPNFLDAEFLAPFKDVPVFIYHGQKDGALSYDLAVKLSDSLTSAGAIVTFSGPENMGHTYQDPATHALFLRWLEQF
ncbi:MAG: alpha/beta hydrolase-fold protein [Pseudomonadota bacterium]